MDTKNEKSFTVYLPDKKLKFLQLREGLYARNSHKSEKKSFQFTGMLKNEQENFVTKEKAKKAETATKFQKAMRFPSHDDLKKAIGLNFFKKSNIRCADVDLATKIYGIDISTKKRKIVRKNSSKTTHNKIEIPEDLITQNK